MRVLDHGYVNIIESWGCDEQIVATARVSTQRGFRGWGPTCAGCGGAQGEDHALGCSPPYRWEAGDEKLLRYLADNHHDTPFEFAGAIFEVQAPIFVFREWHRHRTQSVSEASARYAPLPDVNYMPSVERTMIASGANKQAGAVKGSDALTTSAAANWLAELETLYAKIEAHYQAGLSAGIPKEVARVALPVGRYSRMRVQANLRNWIGFCRLRCAPNAQWEIRQYADSVRELLTRQFPRTMELM